MTVRPRLDAWMAQWKASPAARMRPPPPPPPPPTMADEPQQALRALEERLARASEAAQRLMDEAAGVGGQRKPPASGWESGRQEPASRGPAPELETLLAAIRSLRELIPPDVADRLVAAAREFLLAVRALLDWYLERLERRRTEPPEVQDIPIQ